MAPLQAWGLARNRGRPALSFDVHRPASSPLHGMFRSSGYNLSLMSSIITSILYFLLFSLSRHPSGEQAYSVDFPHLGNSPIAFIPFQPQSVMNRKYACLSNLDMTKCRCLARREALVVVVPRSRSLLTLNPPPL
jgi:hypothetical protein